MKESLTLNDQRKKDLEARTELFQYVRQVRHTKSVIAIINVLTLFVVANVPIHIVQLTETLSGIQIDQVHTYWTTLLYLMGTCAINPIVYGLADKTLLSAYKRNVKGLRRIAYFN